MQMDSTSTHAPRTRTRLKAAHRRTACRLEVAFDTPAHVRLAKFMKQSVRLNVTRLANLVGTGRAAGVAKTYTRAMLALYEKQARGEDIRLALRAVQYIARYMNPRNFDPTPSTPCAAATRSPKALATSEARETEVERTRRLLLDSLRDIAERPETVRLTHVSADNSRYLAPYGVKMGDTLRATLDGDAEHGELALVTYYDLARRARIFYAGFVFIEGERFCMRYRDRDACAGNHHAADELTIIGRVVRVERGGLPVRLKGLELRGLPLADDVEEVEEEGRRAA